MTNQQLIERAMKAEGRELDAMAAEYVMGWHINENDCDFWANSEEDFASRIELFLPHDDLNDVIILESKIEQRGLWREYEACLIEVLDYSAFEKSFLSKYPYIPMDCMKKILRATAAQRTRACILTALKAKEDVK